MNVRITDMQIAKDINYAGVKVCKNCEVEYPATEKYFYRAKGNKDGLRCECKRCTDKAQYQKKVKDLKSLDNVKSAEIKDTELKRILKANTAFSEGYQEIAKDNEKKAKKITRLYKINGILGSAFIIAVAGIIVTYIVR